MTLFCCAQSSRCRVDTEVEGGYLAVMMASRTQRNSQPGKHDSRTARVEWSRAALACAIDFLSLTRIVSSERRALTMPARRTRRTNVRGLLVGTVAAVSALGAQPPVGRSLPVGSCWTLPANRLVGNVNVSAGVRDGNESLCPMANAWMRWHLTGVARLALGEPMPADSVFQLVDVVFAMHRPKMPLEVVVRADSLLRPTAGAGDTLLFLTMVDHREDSTRNADTVQWVVRVVAARFGSDSSTFAGAIAETIGLPSPAVGVRLRTVAANAGAVRYEVLQKQFAELSVARRGFGRATAPRELDVLLGPPRDTSMGWLGVRRATSPFYAFLMSTPSMLVSPITAGGVDPHELGHLMYADTPGSPPVSFLAGEAFAIAIGGSFGHTLAEETCGAHRKLANAGGPTTTPAAGPSRLAVLMLARAMRDALDGGIDSTRFFADGRWVRVGAEWRDLGSLLGVPADSLLRAATERLERETATCPRDSE